MLAASSTAGSGLSEGPGSIRTSARCKLRKRLHGDDQRHGGGLFRAMVLRVVTERG